ncbi:helix-turn-helix transcriptional regulator [Lentzea sp. NBRC 102530]|uniref:helix-turn-helix domain-containing protein n=1 Tax=Lentzea sp. NBRC 102530 TaxID=3032201 RepID=UPI0024A4B1A7|nr:helix-turn-helix transcriptional regulator [Lentzea sp. NBRC 102530]GLY51443.1 hypothetical protein Lesp01_50990 [Lentzea sp. NBRC 102530]
MPRRISTVRLRELAQGVRAVVERAGLNSRHVAELVGCDEAKISEVLNGKAHLSEFELIVLLSVCRPKAEERERLLALYPSRDVRGWWQQHGKAAPVCPSTAMAQVATATELVDWQPLVLPAFLRTDEYTRELLMASAQVPEEKEMAARLCVQIQLRKLLRNGLASTFYIHEFALRLEVGDAGVRAEQMLLLLIAATWDYVTIRIVPAAIGAHAGLSGPFTQLKFEKYEPVVWLEALNSSTFVEKQDAVDGYAAVVRKLNEVSLSPEKSLELIKSLHTG